MAGRESRNDRQVAELVLQLARVAYGDCGGDGLSQAQWMALRFFDRANRFSRTISGFADFHATTRGTASQTVRSLEDQGYLTRSRSHRDRRSHRFDLTALARKKLIDDPLDDLVMAAENLTAKQQTMAMSGLRRMLQCLVEQRERSGVGVCSLCGHLDSGTDTPYQCCLMQEPLQGEEIGELCVRFSPATGQDG